MSYLKAMRTLRIAGAAGFGAVAGALWVNVCITSAAAQTAPASPASPRLLPRDELLRRLKAGETAGEIERTAATPRSAALELFCTHAYRVASFPAALDSIAAQTEISLASFGDDDAAGAVVAAAATHMGMHFGAETWAGLKSRVRVFAVGPDCPSVYANPFTAAPTNDWIVTREAPDGLHDLEFPGARPRVPRMGYGFYANTATGQAMLAVFVGSRERTLLLERLGLLEIYFQGQRNLSRLGSGKLDGNPLETFGDRTAGLPGGRTRLSWLQANANLNDEVVRALLLDELRRAGTRYAELGGICAVDRSRFCEVDPHMRVGAACGCTFTHKEQSGTQEVVEENFFGEETGRWEEPVWRDVQTAHEGTVVRRLTR